MKMVKNGESDGAGKEVGVERERGRGRGVHWRRDRDADEDGVVSGMPGAQANAAMSVGSAVDLLTMLLTLS